MLYFSKYLQDPKRNNWFQEIYAKYDRQKGEIHQWICDVESSIAYL